MKSLRHILLGAVIAMVLFCSLGFYDWEYITSNSDTTVSYVGYEAKEARVRLLADQDDDATDGWELAASTSGTLTIGNDSSTAGTFVDKLTITGSSGDVTTTGIVAFGSGRTIADVVVTTGTYAVLAADSGKIHVIPDLAGATDIDLPVEADGLYYEFWYVGAADEAHTHTIDSGSNTNFFTGGVAFADSNAGDAADEIHAGVYSDGNSNSKLALINVSAGTVVKITCDGTHWYVTGIVVSNDIPTFADQS